MTKRVLLSWSSGKDSAWALHVLRQDPSVQVVGLLTTMNDEAGRVAMHAVRRELVRAQADAAGLSLDEIALPWPCSNEAYDQRMQAAVTRARAGGVTHVAFGDLFLEDVRAYREARLRETGIQPVFPLWGRPTAALAREMLDAGLKARLTCVDPRVVPREAAGREFDSRLLAELPRGVDPCGERGEFHTFAYAGPMFARAIPIAAGETVERDGFVFADLTVSTPHL